MKKSERQIEMLIDSLVEVVNIEKTIDALPRGYISVKSISGHTYYYRQWREGDKIISSYVPESYLKIIKQKIEIRKQNEELLKILKKDLKKAKGAVVRCNALSGEQIEDLKNKISSLDFDSEEAVKEIANLKKELIK